MSEYSIQYLEAAKILTYGALSFFLAMWWAPWLIRFLVWLKFWKKNSRHVATTGEELVVTKQFYKENEEQRKIPRAGGILIWVTSLAIATFFWLFLKLGPGIEPPTDVESNTKMFQFLNFVSRQETFIPLGTFFFGSMLGLIDDALVTMEHGGNYHGGGLHLGQRAFLVIIFSLFIGLWFFRLGLDTFSIFAWKIDLSAIDIPFGIRGGLLVVPMTLVILLASWGTGIIDGFDGLAAGVFIPLYMCFGGLAFAKGYYNITTLLVVMAGATTAYMWYNIPPAKFYLGDTGTVGILLTLGVVAIYLDYIYIMPIAGLVLFLTEGSAVIQVFSKKVFKKKVFLAAPLHHHLEAIGWERHQITMRYWLISLMTSGLGLAIGLLFR